MKHLPASVPVVILTPLASERRAVAQHLTELRQEFFENDLYETGYFKGLHHEYVITLRETGPKNTQIALATQKAIRLFHPTLLLLTGIAGGVKDVRIGDLVVGTRAYGYESGKETDDGPLSRPDVLPFSKELIEVARMVGRAAHWRQRSTDKAPDAAVLFGPIASGDKVIASTASPLYHYLKRHFNDTLALEMESIGFAQAAAPHRNVFALNIRGISDLLDHKSEGDETARQQMAAERAAAFVFELLYILNCEDLGTRLKGIAIIESESENATAIEDNKGNHQEIITQSGHPLKKYPPGPIVEAHLINSVLIQNYAKTIRQSDTLQIIAAANALLIEADPDAATIKEYYLAPVFTVTPYSFWVDVFKEARLCGPRMVAALLLVVPPLLFESAAQENRRQLLEFDLLDKKLP